VPSHGWAAPTHPEPLPEPPPRYWYGWQTLIVDGVSNSLFALSWVGSGVGAVSAGMGIGGFTLGGPIVHWAHGNVGKGFGALGLNVLFPLLGAPIGIAAQTQHSEASVVFGAFLGAEIAYLLANVVDVAALAYAERPAPSPTLSRALPFTILPTLDLRKDRASLGVMGTF
jgi:hypothetical protein